MAIEEYPTWGYYPPSATAPPWVFEFVEAVRSTKGAIESRSVNSLTSDVVLAHLATKLQLLGYQVETGKGSKDKIRRPVLFGLNGRGRVTYPVALPVDKRFSGDVAAVKDCALRVDPPDLADAKFREPEIAVRTGRDLKRVAVARGNRELGDGP